MASVDDIVARPRPARTRVPPPEPGRPRRRARVPPPAHHPAWWLLVPVVLAATLSLGLLLFGPPGVDRAAHVHQTRLFEEYGWRVWDNYWYAGRYELVNYSVLYYPLAALVGEAVVVVASIVGSVALFARLAARLTATGGRPAAIAFALLLPTLLVAGQYPFALAVLFALLALALLQSGRHVLALAAACACLLSNPLAFLLLGIVLAGVAVGRRDVLGDRRALVVGAGIVTLTLAEIVVLRLFPSGGTFPYTALDVLGVALFALAGALAARRGVPRLAGVFVVYGLVGLALFAFPSSVGGNIARLIDYFALPLLLLVLAPTGYRPRLLAVAAIVVAVLWQAIPVARDLRGALQEGADGAAFWAGAVDFLERHHDPNFRVEVVATWGHWESYHVASRGIPITRGWFRQDDFPVNQALYTGDLDAARYEEWLRSLAVRYVVLPNERLDYSARREAEILASPQRGRLRSVYRDANTEIFELQSPTPLVTSTVPSAVRDPERRTEVVQFGRRQVFLWLAEPGVYDLRIRYTPYWRVDEDDVCVASAGPSNLTRLHAHRAGPVRLHFDLTLARSTSQALGRGAQSCAFPPIGGSAD